MSIAELAANQHHPPEKLINPVNENEITSQKAPISTDLFDYFLAANYAVL